MGKGRRRKQIFKVICEGQVPGMTSLSLLALKTTLCFRKDCPYLALVYVKTVTVANGPKAQKCSEPAWGFLEASSQPPTEAKVLTSTSP